MVTITLSSFTFFNSFIRFDLHLDFTKCTDDEPDAQIWSKVISVLLCFALRKFFDTCQKKKKDSAGDYSVLKQFHFPCFFQQINTFLAVTTPLYMHIVKPKTKVKVEFTKLYTICFQIVGYLQICCTTLREENDYLSSSKKSFD